MFLFADVPKAIAKQKRKQTPESDVFYPKIYSLEILLKRGKQFSIGVCVSLCPSSIFV